MKTKLKRVAMSIDIVLQFQKIMNSSENSEKRTRPIKLKRAQGECLATKSRRRT